MRQLSLILLLFIFCLSCKKDTTQNPPPPPPPPSGGGGGGSTGTVTATGVSPLFVYGGDVLTITGTGFSTDITKDTIAFGVVNAGVFGFPSFGNGVKFKIKNATATQIQIVMDSGLTMSAFNAGLKYSVAVHTPGGVGFTGNLLDLRSPLSYSMDATGPGYTNCYTIFTDDSIILSGQSLYPPMTLTINGKVLNMISDNNNGLSARAHIPIDFFGQPDGLAECPGSKFFDITGTNGDGKTFTRQAYFYEGPASTLYYSIDKSTYNLSSSTQAIIHLTGYALRDDIYIAIHTLDLADNSTTFKLINAGVGTGWPSTHDVTIDLGSLPKPKSTSGVSVQINTQVGSAAPVDGYGFGGTFLLYN